jgi:hypothetical protein
MGRMKGERKREKGRFDVTRTWKPNSPASRLPGVSFTSEIGSKRHCQDRAALCYSYGDTESPRLLIL